MVNLPNSGQLSFIFSKQKRNSAILSAILTPQSPKKPVKKNNLNQPHHNYIRIIYIISNKLNTKKRNRNKPKKQKEKKTTNKTKTNKKKQKKKQPYYTLIIIITPTPPPRAAELSRFIALARLQQRLRLGFPEPSEAFAQARHLLAANGALLGVLVPKKNGWVFMGFSWFFHGFFMFCSWVVHGFSWFFHGFFMGFSWVFKGFFIGFSCFFKGFFS